MSAVSQSPVGKTGVGVEVEGGDGGEEVKQAGLPDILNDFPPK